MRENMEVEIGMSSVEILKETNMYRGKALYIHEIVVGDGKVITMGKVMKINDILLLKNSKPENFTEVDVKLVNKLIKLLDTGMKMVKFSNIEMMSLMRLASTIDYLKGIEELAVHLRGIQTLDKEDLDMWKKLLERGKEDLTGVSDLTGMYKRVVIDDGVTRESFVAEVDVAKDIKVGDIIEVVVGYNTYFKGNEYVVAKEPKEFERKIKRVNNVMQVN